MRGVFGGGKGSWACDVLGRGKERFVYWNSALDGLH